MTAKTSQHLADTLRASGFDDLAKRAEADEFHDYLSPHGLPEVRLDTELAMLANNAKTQHQRLAAHQESDEWAASAEGQAAFGELIKGLKQP